MKTAFVLSALFVGAQSFGIAPVTQNSRMSTQVFGAIAESEMSENQLKILEIQKKWSVVRMMDRADAEKELDEEWLAAYNRFFEKYDDDMIRMTEIVEKVMMDPPRMTKKSKGQKRRDAIARKIARSDAAAAAAIADAEAAA